MSREEIDAIFKCAHIGFNATVGNNTLHLRNQTGGYDCTIWWGDGSKSTAPVNGGNVVHSYVEAGVKEIIITGNSFAGFYVNNQIGKEKYAAAYSMGQWETDTMTNFDSCFYGCTSLTTLPTDLFRYNTAVTDFNSCFYGCTGLTLRSDIFGSDTASRFSGETVNFRGCFSRSSFSGTQGTAPALWDFKMSSRSKKTGCFGGAGNSSTSLSNYSSIPSEWK